MLETTAEQLICPFSQLMNDGTHVYSNLGQMWNTGTPATPYCIGSKCMCWVQRTGQPNTPESSGACGLVTGQTGIFT